MFRYSRHAQARSQQRAIRRDLVDLCVDYGRGTRSYGDQVFLLDDRAMRAMPGQTHADRGRGLCVVLAADGTVKTLKWKHRIRHRPGVLGRRWRTVDEAAV